MASLLTQCPQCQTSFRVSRMQLAIAEGQVRCGSCLGVFSARENEIRVKVPQPPLLDQPLTEEELYSVASGKVRDFDDDEAEDGVDGVASEEGAAPDNEFTEYVEYEDNATQPDRTGSWLDYDEDEFEYEEDESTASTATQPVAEYVDEDEEEELGTYVDEDEDESEDDDEDDDEDQEDDEDEINDEYSDEVRIDDQDAAGFAEEDYADEYDGREPVLREPVLNLDEPVFGGQTRDEVDDPLFADHRSEPSFNATRDDDDEAEHDEDDYRAVRARYAAPHSASDKRQVRRYVEELEDDEALDELDPHSLDYIDDEPVQIAAPRRKRGLFGTLLLVLGSLVLIAVLALQFLGANVEELNQSARFTLLRPLVCGFIDCPAPPEAPSTLIHEQLAVRAHPTLRDALEVSALLRNNGAATQPLPGIELIFRNAQDEMIASRLFTPQEYLPPELRTATSLPSQSSMQVRLEIANPGPDALNYELVFRPLPPSGRR